MKINAIKTYNTSFKGTSPAQDAGNKIAEAKVKKTNWKGIGFGVFIIALISGIIMAADKGLQNRKNKINTKV